MTAQGRRVSPFRDLRIEACLPAPRSLSQATTSFIASRCQGIHRAPLVASSPRPATGNCLAATPAIDRDTCRDDYPTTHSVRLCQPNQNSPPEKGGEIDVTSPLLSQEVGHVMGKHLRTLALGVTISLATPKTPIHLSRIWPRCRRAVRQSGGEAPLSCGPDCSFRSKLARSGRRV